MRRLIVNADDLGFAEDAVRPTGSRAARELGTPFSLRLGIEPIGWSEVSMTHRIGVIAGDGAGPEVITEARKAVDALGLELEWNELPWGSAYFHETG